MILDVMLGAIFIGIIILAGAGMALNLQKDTPVMDSVKRNKYMRYYINLFGD